jgi:porphobilinogen synthase
MNYNHRLHAGYFHHITRTWQEIAGSHAGRLPDKRQIVYPLFVLDGEDTEHVVEPISSMPGLYRFGKYRLIEHLRPLIERGLSSVLLFGVIGEQHRHWKDDKGSRADAKDGAVISAIEVLKKAFPNLLLICDVCLCDYTSHGHCGILCEDGSVHHDKSLQRLAEIALAYAQTGAHIVAPSDMMDDRVQRIKKLLHKHDLEAKVAVMSYSAKFASCLYSPFREAAHSAPTFGDRLCYQLPPGSRGLALRALVRKEKPN